MRNGSQLSLQRMARAQVCGVDALEVVRRPRLVHDRRRIAISMASLRRGSSLRPCGGRLMALGDEERTCPL